MVVIVVNCTPFLHSLLTKGKDYHQLHNKSAPRRKLELIQAGARSCETFRQMNQQHGGTHVSLKRRQGRLCDGYVSA